MAEDIFKEFSPSDIAKAYEELCADICAKTDAVIGDANADSICCDDDANGVIANNQSNNVDTKKLSDTAAPDDENGKNRADSVIACMGSVNEQMESMSKNSTKIQDLITLKYLIEELYYHYLVLGQYYVGKRTFVKYMIDETAAGGIRASKAAKHFATALTQAPPSSFFSKFDPDRTGSKQLRTYTDQGIFAFDDKRAKLDMRLDSGLDKEYLLPVRYRDYHKSNPLMNFLNKGRQNNGQLYDNYLDSAAHLDKVFTLQERGLSVDTPDPTLVGTGAEVYLDKFIGDMTTFNTFFSNFKNKFEMKMSDVVTSLPDLAYAAGESLRLQAEYEAATKIVSVGRVAALSWAINDGSFYDDKLSQITKDLTFVIKELKDTEAALLASGDAVTQVTCLGPAAGEGNRAPAIDSDSAARDGGLAFSNTIDYPNITDMAYWRRFATIATLVGILPLPGPGLFRYWPIGLILPPGIKIPLPIIWLPIKAIPTPFGIFVFFIGLSGIFPSPFLFFISPTGQKSFLISITPTKPFGSDSSSPPTKPFSMGGIAVPTPIFTMPTMTSKESSAGMIQTFGNKVKDSIAIKQDDLTAYNLHDDKSEVVRGIISRSAASMDFNWSYPADSSKINPKLSDSATFKAAQSGGAAKSAVTGMSIIGNLGKIHAPKLPFGPAQPPIKIGTSTILPQFLKNIKINSDIVPQTAQDLKTIVVEGLDDGMSKAEDHFASVLSVADSYSSISPKTIPEAFKLPKLSFSTDTVDHIDPKVLETAQQAVKIISLIPYPAVAFLPSIFKQLHPILSNDDLPPWERLSLKNFLFVAFLDEFCSTGKMGSILPI